MNALSRLLASGRPLLADGATGTNLFAMGLTSGDAPERWNLEHPDRVRELHRRFVEAGADVVLTNTFGANARRLALHGLDTRVREVNRVAAQLARSVADAAGRTVVVGGSVGPTGELFEPLGALTESAAVEVFAEQIAGLAEGGADVAWIETMSALEEIRAAVLAAAQVGLPCTFTASFDTAGRTMMGVTPQALVAFAQSLEPRPLAIGANCGVGAADLVMSVLGLTAHDAGIPVIAKANAGIPRVSGAHVHYSGTPDLMARYVELAADAGARIIGGCCGTGFDHLAAMRAALDAHGGGERPDEARVVEMLGPLQAPAARIGEAASPREGRRSRRPGPPVG
ncbi:MAG TPA: betaine--homocysteine S-methyltransferase [Steroidobacteraceae bacterium]|nr:betaine--homocysteine S-methyltransferase [Steroidobacteraceae bacterium]